MNNGQLQHAPKKNGDSLALAERRIDDELRQMSRAGLEKFCKRSFIAFSQTLAQTSPWIFEERVGESIAVTEVAGRIVKIRSRFVIPQMTCDFAKREVTCAAASASINIEAASEGDLIDLQQLAERGSDQVILRKWIKKLRQADEAPKPIEIKIVNANELAPATKVMAVKRDSSGKLSGAVVESVPDPS